MEALDIKWASSNAEKQEILMLFLMSILGHIDYLRIPVNLATDSGVNWPPVGAKRRRVFILPQGGRHESTSTSFSSSILLSTPVYRHGERSCP